MIESLRCSNDYFDNHAAWTDLASQRLFNGLSIQPTWPRLIHNFAQMNILSSCKWVRLIEGVKCMHRVNVYK